MFTPLFDDSNLMPGDNSGIDGNEHTRRCEEAYEDSGSDSNFECICGDSYDDEGEW